MTDYLLKPRNLLTFSLAQDLSDGSGQIRTALFPRPSAVAGALRARWFATQRVANPDENSMTKLSDDARKIHVNGVFYAVDNEVITPLLPVPLDAVPYFVNRERSLVPAGPNKMDRFGIVAPKGTNRDSEIALRAPTLPASFVNPLRDNKSTPVTAPTEHQADLWRAAVVLRWMAGDPRHGEIGQVAEADIGLTPEENIGYCWPTIESRIHVEIERDGHVNKEGMLFSEQGLVFDTRVPASVYGEQDAQAGNKKMPTPDALIARVACRELEIPHTGSQRLGGRRGRATVKPIPSCLPPRIPPRWLDTIVNQRRFRLYLATPGLFADGKPGPECDGFRLVSMASGKPAPNHAWDMRKGRPRALTYCMPPGTVYWYEECDGSQLSDRDIAQRVQSWWLSSCSDIAQARADGYGIALPGPWMQIADTD